MLLFVEQDPFQEYYSVVEPWYTGDERYDFWLSFGFGFALFTVLGSLFMAAPYGRFANPAFGVDFDPRFGWWLMEIPATISFLYFYPQGDNAWKPVPMFLAFLWLRHYSNRGWYFPLTLKVQGKSTFSILVVACGMLMTSFHGFLNAQWFSQFGSHLSNDWVKSPWFILGWLTYELSFWLTVYSESIIRNLRDGKGPRYKIPYGGGFKYITSPAYFGELLGWLGWSIMSRNPAGLVVFLISCGNLVPRAFATQRWYHEKFEDYPKDRKVLIPFLL